MKYKYDPLEIYLRNKPKSDNEVRLSFREIESIIGAQLPPASIKHRPWWVNQKNLQNRPQAKAWQNAGFIVESVQQKANSGSVNFKRK